MEKAGTGGTAQTPKSQRACGRFQRFACQQPAKRRELRNETRAALAAPLLRMSGTKAPRPQSSTVPGTGDHVHASHRREVRVQRGGGHSAPILLPGTPRLSSHTITWAARAVGLAPPPPRPAAHLFVPDLQGLAADAVEDGEEAALERVLEHLAGRGPAAALGPGLRVGTERRRPEEAAGPKEGR